MTRRLLSCLFAAVVLLAACGGDDDAVDAAADDTADVAETTDTTGSSDDLADDGAANDGGTTSTDETASTDADTADVPEFFDFALEDVRGGEVEGASFAGADVVVWFWAPWCTLCNQEAADIAALAEARDDVAFLGMAGLDGLGAAQDFVDRHGLDGFAHAYDEAGDAWQDFGVTSQSSFAFVNDDGSFETETYVSLGGEEIERRIDELVAA